MADRISPAALKASFGTLRGYLDDLARAQFKDHATKLRLFVNYFQKDDTVRYLADRLHTRLADVLEAALKPEVVLPEDPADRLAFVYGVVYHLKQGHKLEVREFLSRAIPGSSLDAKWDDFRKKWITVLVEGFAELGRSVDSELGDELVDPEPLFRRVLESRAGTGTGAGAGTGTGTGTGSGTGTGTGTLKDAVARLAEDQKGDLPIEVEILALERSKRRPDPHRLEEIVSSFEAVSPELGALARTEAALPATKTAAKKTNQRAAASAETPKEKTGEAKRKKK
jgi:hypothetical protein